MKYILLLTLLVVSVGCKDKVYEFSNEPMHGKIDGKIWKPKFVKIVEQFVIPAEQKESFYSLVANRNCAVRQCSHIKLDNIDLNTDGGNLSFKKMVVFYTFPSINVFASTGSYRVTQIDNETKKLELTIRADEDNYINGYFIINANSTLDTRMPKS